MASSSASPDKTYAAIYLMPLFNVADKFFSKSTLYSPTFTCSEDPLQTSFQLSVEFKENQIDIQVKPTSRKVRIQRADFKLFDEKMRGQENARFTPPPDRPYKHFQDVFWPGLKGFSKSLTRPLPSDGEFNELRLLVDVRYNAKFPFSAPGRLACLDALAYDTFVLFDPSYMISDYDVEIEEDFDFCIRVEEEEIRCHKVILL